VRSAKKHFHLPSSPKPLKNNNRVIANFFENWRRYSKIKVHHRINGTGGIFAAGINYISGKFSNGPNGILRGLWFTVS
jgi:hypothetical protein